MKNRILAALIALAGMAIAAAAQTGPSVSTTVPVAFAAGTPAISVTITNPGMAATQVNSNGIESAGPGTTELWYCIGNGSQCGSSMLPPQSSDTPPQGSGWVLAGSVAQTSSTITVALLNVTFGNLYQIAARSQWTAGGGFGAFPSTFLAVSVPTAPTAQPPAANTAVVAVIL